MSTHGDHVRVAVSTKKTHCSKRHGLSRRQEHEEERVSWKHSLRSASASQLEQRSDRYRDELWEAELYAPCMAAQQAMGTENMARELGVYLDAMELQVDANAAIGIIGRQGLGKLRHLDMN